MINTPGKDSSVEACYKLIQPLYYHELEVVISATADTRIEGWLGATLRNRLLFAADHIRVIGGVSLRQIIELITINNRHPLYKKMEQGFPRGYSISLLSHHHINYPYTLQAGESITFSLLLYGHFSGYYQTFMEALQEVCDQGLGHPLRPFRLVSISERSPEDVLHPLSEDLSASVAPLQHPVTLQSFARQPFSTHPKEIKIRYDVPVNFFKSIGKGDDPCKDKGHEFPGFYQLVHAAAYRVATLAALYASPDDLLLYHTFDKLADDFLKYARNPVLTAANLKRVDQYVIKKPGARHPIRLTGYVGEACFSGNFESYLPLLLFARNIGVGSHATYGMGRYKVIK